MKPLGKFSLVLVTVLLINYGLAFGQSDMDKSTQTYELTESSTMTVSGTSTIHDWESDVEQINSKLTLNSEFLAAQKGADIDKALKTEVSVPVESIESGKSGMNKKMYNALNKDDHPNIKYNLLSSKLAETELDSEGSSGQFTLDTTGELTINGVTKEVSMQVVGEKSSDGNLHFKGEKEMDMETFEVDPPSAMFGTVKAGKMITISFDVTYAPVK